MSIISTNIDTITTFVSHFSSQYHIYFECNVQFLSISRLLTYTQKVNCFKQVCKHCEKDFNFNNQFHEHVRLKHARRFVNSFTFSINSLALKTSFKAFQSLILHFKTLHAFILHAHSTLFFTFSYMSSLSCQKSSIQSINRTFQKFYMIIDDFYIMFHEKSFKKSVNIIQKRVFSLMFNQTHIIDYFILVALTSSINKRNSIKQNNCKTFTFSTSQSTRTLFNKKSKVSHIAIDEIANLKTQRRFKVFKYELSIALILSINQRSRSSQTQNLKQSSNVSNSIFLHSITLFLTLQVNHSIKHFNVRVLNISITSSWIKLIRTLICVTIIQLNKISRLCWRLSY